MEFYYIVFFSLYCLYVFAKEALNRQCPAPIGLWGLASMMTICFVVWFVQLEIGEGRRQFAMILIWGIVWTWMTTWNFYGDQLVSLNEGNGSKCLPVSINIVTSVYISGMYLVSALSLSGVLYFILCKLWDQLFEFRLRRTLRSIYQFPNRFSVERVQRFISENNDSLSQMSLLEFERNLIHSQLTKRLEHPEQTVLCSICFENLVQGNSACILKCTHQFHPECIRTWLDIKPNCPICKKSFRLAILERLKLDSQDIKY